MMHRNDNKLILEHLFMGLVASTAFSLALYCGVCANRVKFASLWVKIEWDNLVKKSIEIGLWPKFESKNNYYRQGNKIKPKFSGCFMHNVWESEINHFDCGSSGHDKLIEIEAPRTTLKTLNLKIKALLWTCSTAAPCSLLLKILESGRGGSLGFVALSGRFGGMFTGGGRGAGDGSGGRTGAGGEGLSSVTPHTNWWHILIMRSESSSSGTWR